MLIGLVTAFQLHALSLIQNSLNARRNITEQKKFQRAVEYAHNILAAPYYCMMAFKKSKFSYGNPEDPNQVTGLDLEPSLRSTFNLSYLYTSYDSHLFKYMEIDGTLDGQPQNRGDNWYTIYLKVKKNTSERSIQFKSTRVPLYVHMDDQARIDRCYTTRESDSGITIEDQACRTSHGTDYHYKPIYDPDNKRTDGVCVSDSTYYASTN